MIMKDRNEEVLCRGMGWCIVNFVKQVQIVDYFSCKQEFESHAKNQMLYLKIRYI